MAIVGLRPARRELRRGTQTLHWLEPKPLQNEYVYDTDYDLQASATEQAGQEIRRQARKRNGGKVSQNRLGFYQDSRRTLLGLLLGLY